MRWGVQAGSGAAVHPGLPQNLRAGGYPSVSRVFRACNAPRSPSPPRSPAAQYGGGVSTTPFQGQQYAGQRLGLPEAGRGSVASWRRRVLALVIDWFGSLAAAAFIASALGLGDAWRDWLPLLVFWLESSVGVALAAGSFGQLAVRIAVRRADGRPLDPAGAFLRQLLICLVVPAVVYNRDNRGLHDLAVRSVVVDR